MQLLCDSATHRNMFPKYALLTLAVGYLVIPCVLVSSQDIDAPIGAASLAFVFDITGSMYDDLVQVIEGAAKILATALSRREKPLYNYVLVPFHDPGKLTNVYSFCYICLGSIGLNQFPLSITLAFSDKTNISSVSLHPDSMPL